MSEKKRNIPVCVPFLNGNEMNYVNEAMSTGWISSSGAYVSKFENKFSEYCGMRFGVAVTNGTVALHLALLALGIGKGDEVIIPSFTMIATAFAVCYTGAMPVFIDVNKDTWNMDVSLIEKKITNKTKAIIPVHIFGNPCAMYDICNIARKHNLFVVEDAAEAHGAEYKGRKVGSFSDIACFSFFANKNITTGEGGMCITNDEEYKNRCSYFKNMCFQIDGNRNYVHDDLGYNYRMSNIHAAIGVAQIEKIDEYIRLRINNHRYYKKKISDIPGITFQKDEIDCKNVCWMNAIIVDKDKYGLSRDELIRKLNNSGIDTRLLFVGMNRQPSLKKYGCDCGDQYHVTDWLSENGLYLPSASNLSHDEIDYICDVIASGYRGEK